MNPLKERLKENVPPRYSKMPEFSILLKIITSEDLQTKTQLRKYLNSEIQTAKNELTESDTPTLNRKRVRLAKKIDFLRLCHDKILPYCK